MESNSQLHQVVFSFAKAAIQDSTSSCTGVAGCRGYWCSQERCLPLYFSATFCTALEEAVARSKRGMQVLLKQRDAGRGTGRKAATKGVNRCCTWRKGESER